MGLNLEVQIVNSSYNIHRNNFFCVFVGPHEQEQTSVFWKQHVFQQGFLFPAYYHLSGVGIYSEKSCSANPVACISPVHSALGTATLFSKGSS